MWTSVGEEGVRKTKAFEHVFDIIQGCLSGINRFVTRDRDYPLSRSVVDNDHDAVIPIANQEIRDKVACHLGKRGGVSLTLDWYQAG